MVGVIVSATLTNQRLLGYCLSEFILTYPNTNSNPDPYHNPIPSLNPNYRRTDNTIVTLHLSVHALTITFT